MSEMRLIVAGAGGRMGRALTRVISETSGAVLTGALEAPGSELLGKDAASSGEQTKPSTPSTCACWARASTRSDTPSR